VRKSGEEEEEEEEEETRERTGICPKLQHFSIQRASEPAKWL
jgi:hypothetical protein